MSIYQLKAAFQKLLRPLTQFLARRHITPNQVTGSAVFLSLITGLFILLFPTSQLVLLSIPFVMLVRMMLNAIDGMLAREHGMQTALGAFYNELGDVFSDTFLYVPFCFIPGLWFWLVLAIVLLAVISEMAGVVAVQVGASRRYDGPMGKSDRAFVFAVMSILLALNGFAAYWINYGLIIVFALLIYTIINRVNKALKEMGNGHS
jgi:CDP-diacylglycerol---glycerol-3-phosphate 3-phosphatidyltransferase